jgi:hypothetical protein
MGLFRRRVAAAEASSAPADFRVVLPLLTADCGRCEALCCSLPFSRGREFPEDKPEAVACRHVTADHRCGRHGRLWAEGWRGCVTFDCFGAGQHICQVTYAGVERPDVTERLAAFGVVRQLHEMRFLATDPGCLGSSYAAAAAGLDEHLSTLAAGTPSALLALDLVALRKRAGEIFAGVAAERGGPSLRGELLMAADLRGRDLRAADLLGADLRDANLSGVDLSTTLFLTQPQVTAARGDGLTRLPERLRPPAHWAA